MKTRFIITIGILWIVLGIFLSAPYWLSIMIPKRANVIAVAPDNTAKPQLVTSEKPLIQGEPDRIAFPSLGINKATLPGEYYANTGAWTLSSDEAQFASVTTKPNNHSGNTFIYGHNNQNVFGKLVDATLGLEAVITTKNGHTLRYKLVKITDVSPHDTSYLQSDDTPKLTVQTCSGLWYENRRMFEFELVEAV